MLTYLKAYLKLTPFLMTITHTNKFKKGENSKESMY